MHFPNKEKFGVVTHHSGLFTSCHPQNFKDLNTNRPFLVDTIPEVTVIPRGPNNLTAAQAATLRAMNGTDMRKYGHGSVTLNLGLNRKFRWVFIVADFRYHNIATKFLQHFEPLFDSRHRK